MGQDFEQVRQATLEMVEELQDILRAKGFAEQAQLLGEYTHRIMEEELKYSDFLKGIQDIPEGYDFDAAQHLLEFNQSLLGYKDSFPTMAERDSALGQENEAALNEILGLYAQQIDLFVVTRDEFIDYFKKNDEDVTLWRAMRDKISDIQMPPSFAEAHAVFITQQVRAVNLLREINQADLADDLEKAADNADNIFLNYWNATSKHRKNKLPAVERDLQKAVFDFSNSFQRIAEDIVFDKERDGRFFKEEDVYRLIGELGRISQIAEVNTPTSRSAWFSR